MCRHAGKIRQQPLLDTPFSCVRATCDHRGDDLNDTGRYLGLD
jgi:hypothetical protein